MTDKKEQKPLQLSFDDNSFLMELCGQQDAHLQMIEQRLNVQIVLRGNQIALFGEPEQVEKAKVVLEDLYELIEGGHGVNQAQVDAALRVTDGLIHERLRPTDIMGQNAVIVTPNKKVAPRSVQQHVYVNALKNSTLTFGVGPAGTGKTYLVVAHAVSLLMRKQIKKIILTRPVVEAGESLGFLPGTLEEKIDPYLTPLFDAMDEMIGREKMNSYREHGIIEMAPLAYMRGRTLKDCYMILDEAQNTTVQQMKMFLTRLGENSRAAVTGDPSQVDLTRGQKSGLKDALDVLEGLNDIEVVRFNETDVVRHNLVSRIVKAYDERSRQTAFKLEE